MQLDPDKGNKTIDDLILSNKPFSVSRLGVGEVKLFHRIVNGETPNMGDISQANRFGGVYGDSFDYFVEQYMNAVKNSDVHCFWVGCGLDNEQKELFEILSPNSDKIHHRSVEPFYFNDPWSKSLFGKKVLVIHPFSDSIEIQYKKRTSIWSKEVLPNFELLTYKSVQSIGNLKPHLSWKESLSVMKSDIEALDFDIALLGCGTYGLPLVDFIRNKLNKSAIYIGGSLQILFGIKGKRWDSHDEISDFYNENWIRPSIEETPKNYKVLEGGCYW